MIKTVIESPLAGDFARNKRYALWCAYDCFKRGEAAYASHLFYPQFLDDENPNHRAFGIAAGFAWGAGADKTVFYVDLGWSPGMDRAKGRISPSGLDVLTRCLQPDMWQAFLDGDAPGRTPGFVSPESSNTGGGDS